MSNDMMQFNENTAMANPEDLVNLGSAAQHTAGGSNTMDLLRLMRDGLWVFGADNTEPEDNSLWAINPYSFVHGYISWVDNRPAGEVMVPVLDRLPARSELPETGGSWDEQMGCQLQCVSGEDAGTQVIFKSTSVGGKRELGRIATAIAQAAQNGTDVVPLVKLATDSYQHKKYGRIYTPQFAISSWVPLDSEASQLDVESDEPAVEEPAPKRRRRAS